VVETTPPSPTPSHTPLTPMPTPTLSPTFTPTPTGTPSPTPTEIPSPTSTGTPSLTPTKTLSPTPTVTPTPVPLRLLKPEDGANVVRTDQVTFEWEGTLARGQVYRVVYYRDTNAVTSPDLTTKKWTAVLPAEQYGGYYWYVVVIQNDTQVARSVQRLFWFNPFPQTPSSGPTATPTEPPE
jgi:hypothetical protein